MPSNPSLSTLDSVEFKLRIAGPCPPSKTVRTIVMGIAALLFYALTVEIDGTHLTFRFGVGLIRKRIPLTEIVEVQPVRNSWLYGWGIHRTPHGWLYNVSGWEAVEITLRSSQRLRLGTDQPQHLAQALLTAKQDRS